MADTPGGQHQGRLMDELLASFGAPRSHNTGAEGGAPGSLDASSPVRTAPGHEGLEIQQLRPPDQLQDSGHKLMALLKEDGTIAPVAGDEAVFSFTAVGADSGRLLGKRTPKDPCMLLIGDPKVPVGLCAALVNVGLGEVANVTVPAELMTTTLTPTGRTRAVAQHAQRRTSARMSSEEQSVQPAAAALALPPTIVPTEEGSPPAPALLTAAAMGGQPAVEQLPRETHERAQMWEKAEERMATADAPASAGSSSELGSSRLASDVHADVRADALSSSDALLKPLDTADHQGSARRDQGEVAGFDSFSATRASPLPQHGRGPFYAPGPGYVETSVERRQVVTYQQQELPPAARVAAAAAPNATTNAATGLVGGSAAASSAAVSSVGVSSTAVEVGSVHTSVGGRRADSPALASPSPGGMYERSNTYTSTEASYGRPAVLPDGMSSAYSEDDSPRTEEDLMMQGEPEPTQPQQADPNAKRSSAVLPMLQELALAGEAVRFEELHLLALVPGRGRMSGRTILSQAAKEEQDLHVNVKKLEKVQQVTSLDRKMLPQKKHKVRDSARRNCGVNLKGIWRSVKGAFQACGFRFGGK